MKFGKNKTRRILFREMQKDEYGIKRIPSGRLDRIIDIGANVGIVTCLARLCHTKAEIHSFEPNPKTFKILSKNTEGLDVNLHMDALGDGGYANLIKGRSNLAHSFQVSEKTEDSIRTYPLNQLMIKNSITVDKRTLIKIDCEGGEWSMCNNDDKNILLKAGIICLEVHGNKENSVIDFYNWLLKDTQMRREFGMNFRTGRAGHVLLWDQNHFHDIF